MKILLEDIPPHGVVVRANLSTDWAFQGARAALGADPTALSVDLRVERTGRVRVVVSGKISAAAPSQCGRCLSAVSLALGGDVSLVYTTPDKVADVEKSVDSTVNIDGDQALDEGWFDGIALPLEDVVSEQLALWEPARVRCDGAAVTRLDDGECGVIAYDEGPVVKRPSPFAQLAGLKLPE